MIASSPFYWLVCDHDGCEVKSTEGSDYTAWGDVSGAVDDANDNDWLITDDDRHFCREHWEWCTGVIEMDGKIDICEGEMVPKGELCAECKERSES